MCVQIHQYGFRYESEMNGCMQDSSFITCLNAKITSKFTWEYGQSKCIPENVEEFDEINYE